MSEPIPPTPNAGAAPAESTWLVHYAGSTPLDQAGYTWQPDEALPIPESVARTLIGTNHLRVVQDEEWFHAARARAAGEHHG